MQKYPEESIKKIKTRLQLTSFLEKVARQRLIKDQGREIEKKLRSLPELRLTIAFIPRDDFIDRVSDWVKKELGEEIILDIKVNPKLVGGAQIEYGGVWRDFSIAQTITKLLKKREV